MSIIYLVLFPFTSFLFFFIHHTHSWILNTKLAKTIENQWHNSINNQFSTQKSHFYLKKHKHKCSNPKKTNRPKSPHSFPNLYTNYILIGLRRLIIPSAAAPPISLAPDFRFHQHDEELVINWKNMFDLMLLLKLVIYKSEHYDLFG